MRQAAGSTITSLARAAGTWKLASTLAPRRRATTWRVSDDSLTATSSHASRNGTVTTNTPATSPFSSRSGAAPVPFSAAR